MSTFENEPFVKYQGVGGWLLLLCVVLTIISPLGTIYNYISSYSEVSPYLDQLPGLRNLFYIDGILSTILMVLSIRAGIALWTIKDGAVRTAKIYLWATLVYNVIALFLPYTAGLPEAANDAMIPETIKSAVRALVFFGIWFSYLSTSKRVEATYRTFSFAEETENNSEEAEIIENKDENKDK